MDEILHSVCILAQDQYGNYVIQVKFPLQFAYTSQIKVSTDSALAVRSLVSVEGICFASEFLLLLPRKLLSFFLNGRSSTLDRESPFVFVYAMYPQIFWIFDLFFSGGNEEQDAPCV